jgi:hypothetical protein
MAGLILVIGPQKAVGFFVKPTKWRGTAAFFAGLFLVLIRYTFIGMMVEMFGFINLFGYPLLVCDNINLACILQ